MADDAPQADASPSPIIQRAVSNSDSGGSDSDSGGSGGGGGGGGDDNQTAIEEAAENNPDLNLPADSDSSESTNSSDSGSSGESDGDTGSGGIAGSVGGQLDRLENDGTESFESDTDSSGPQTPQGSPPDPESGPDATSDTGGPSTPDADREQSRVQRLREEGALAGDSDNDGLADFAEPETNPDEIDPNSAPGVVRDQIVQQEARDNEIEDGQEITDEEVEAAFESAENLEENTNTGTEDTQADIERPQQDTTQEQAQRALDVAREAARQRAALESGLNISPEEFSTNVDRSGDQITVSAEADQAALERAVRQQAAAQTGIDTDDLAVEDGQIVFTGLPEDAQQPAEQESEPQSVAQRRQEVLGAAAPFVNSPQSESEDPETRDVNQDALSETVESVENVTGLDAPDGEVVEETETGEQFGDFDYSLGQGDPEEDEVEQALDDVTQGVTELGTEAGSFAAQQYLDRVSNPLVRTGIAAAGAEDEAQAVASQIETNAEGAGQGVGALVGQVPQLATEVPEFVAFAATNPETTADRLPGAVATRAVQLGESAAENPARFGSSLAASVALSGGLFRATQGTRAGTASRVALQPGEELVKAGVRRGALGQRAVRLTPGVREGQIEGDVSSGEASTGETTGLVDRARSATPDTGLDVDAQVGIGRPSLDVSPAARVRLRRVLGSEGRADLGRPIQTDTGESITGNARAAARTARDRATEAVRSGQSNRREIVTDEGQVETASNPLGTPERTNQLVERLTRPRLESPRRQTFGSPVGREIGETSIAERAINRGRRLASRFEGLGGADTTTRDVFGRPIRQDTPDRVPTETTSSDVFGRPVPSSVGATSVSSRIGGLFDGLGGSGTTTRDVFGRPLRQEVATDSEPTDSRDVFGRPVASEVGESQPANTAASGIARLRDALTPDESRTILFTDDGEVTTARNPLGRPRRLNDLADRDPQLSIRATRPVDVSAEGESETAAGTDSETEQEQFGTGETEAETDQEQAGGSDTDIQERPEGVATESGGRQRVQTVFRGESDAESESETARESESESRRTTPVEPAIPGEAGSELGAANTPTVGTGADVTPFTGQEPTNTPVETTIPGVTLDVGQESGQEAGTETETEIEPGFEQILEQEQEQELEIEAETEPGREAPRELFGFGLDGDTDDDSGRFGQTGAAEETLFDFRNPLTGGVLETDADPRSSSSGGFPGL